MIRRARVLGKGLFYDFSTRIRTLSGRKTMHHPTKGVLHFEHTSFQANDDPALKLIIYTPV